jgi:hypothetical protein
LTFKSYEQRLRELDEEIKWREGQLKKLREIRGLIQGFKDRQEVKG